MPQGYRKRALKAKRRQRRQRWQLWALYVLAPIVAAGAVVGAYFLVQALTTPEEVDPDSGRMALIVVGDGEDGPAVAGLALRDPARGAYRFYTVPRAFLLEGPQGEYVMAGDEMGRGALSRDLGRLIGVPIDDELRLGYDDLPRLAGGGSVALYLEEPVELYVDGAWRTYEGSLEIPVAEAGGYLAAEGRSGEDEDAFAQAMFSALFHAGALRTAAERRSAVDTLTAAVDDELRRASLQTTLAGLVARPVEVARLPSEGVVSEGQFAFRPDRSKIMTDVTRLAPGYAAKYTILVTNGTGEAGIGGLVRDRLAVLDAKLPSPSNAGSFDYERTQILAGSEALAMAEDVRAILGHGVVLSGEELPATTLVVIVGADLEAKDLQ